MLDVGASFGSFLDALVMFLNEFLNGLFGFLTDLLGGVSVQFPMA